MTILMPSTIHQSDHLSFHKYFLFSFFHILCSFYNDRESMVREVENNSVPEWVEILLGEKFFTPCSLHISCKKNDKTFFCLFCRSAICFSCFSSHRTHALLQIRRYVYHEVIRLRDAEKLMNCSLVQVI
uniref:B box-type domain-containing protein n=1 Tax=Cucumis melo TaxID=3656 RepID=A0A9I9EHZ2_CUCME